MCAKERMGNQASSVSIQSTSPAFHRPTWLILFFSLCFRSLSAVQLPLKNLNDGASSGSASELGNSVERALTKVDLDVQKIGRVSKADIESIVAEIKANSIVLKQPTIKMYMFLITFICYSEMISSSQSLLLIRCCGNLVPEEHPKERNKLVQEIWSMLESMGVNLNISHYNALLRVYVENEYKLDPMKFLKMLEEKQLEPNRVGSILNY